MNKMDTAKFLEMFDQILQDKHSNVTNLNLLKDLSGETKKGDEVDIVNGQRQEQLKDRLNQRNVYFLKKVEQAKQRILDGTYGVCEECGADISQKRLMARPTACLCIGCQEDKEREEFSQVGKRRDLRAIGGGSSANEDEGNVKKFSSVKDIGFESVVDL